MFEWEDNEVFACTAHKLILAIGLLILIPIVMNIVHIFKFRRLTEIFKLVIIYALCFIESFLIVVHYGII